VSPRAPLQVRADMDQLKGDRAELLALQRHVAGLIALRRRRAEPSVASWSPCCATRTSNTATATRPKTQALYTWASCSSSSRWCCRLQRVRPRRTSS
jgi:hypothetical protein